MSLGAWCAKSSDPSPYLQVDLLRDTIVTGVGSQGMAETGTWVTEYMLSYSCDGKIWSVFGDNGQKKVSSFHVCCCSTDHFRSRQLLLI